MKFLVDAQMPRRLSDLFAKHSWYFRNALVRAKYEDLLSGVHKTNTFLLLFLKTLLFNENYLLKNRALHIHYFDTVKSQNDTVFSVIQSNKHITTSEISKQLGLSPSTIKRKIKLLKKQSLLKRIGSDKSSYWSIRE